MSLNFAAITPHPPILVPELSKPDSKAISSTVLAMEKLSLSFEQSDIDTIVVISPHAESLHNAMTIFAPTVFSGNLSAFGVPEVKVNFSGQKELAQEMLIGTKEAGIAVELVDFEVNLDHGAIVPLYLLSREIGRKINLIEIAFSDLSRLDHQRFGIEIAKIIDKSKDRIAVIASGDLSHRLLDSVYSEEAKEFDQEIVEQIKNNKLSQVSIIEDEVVNAAGECGYRSILILSGILFDKKYKTKVLSYQAPYGIGYLVAKFEL